jgi:hypothetical protein
MQSLPGTLFQGSGLCIGGEGRAEKRSPVPTEREVAGMVHAALPKLRVETCTLHDVAEHEEEGLR